MKKIPLSRGQFALVDDCDFKDMSKYKWHALKNQSGTWYAYRSYKYKKDFYRKISMHRQILDLGYGDKRQGDHRNHNGLDNQRHNLRLCTVQQNQFNQKVKSKTSKYKGVSWCQRTKKWFSLIQIDGRSIFLGRFYLEELAALAYDFAALRYHREFACFNF